ncbi:MAG: hypothetical protein WAZ40_00870 [Minisyncoccia bacterium]
MEKEKRSNCCWVWPVLVFLTLLGLLGWQYYTCHQCRKEEVRNVVVEKITPPPQKIIEYVDRPIPCDKPKPAIRHQKKPKEVHTQRQMVKEDAVPSAVVIEKIPSAVVVERDPSISTQGVDMNEGLLDGVDTNFIERKSEEPVDVVVPKRRRVVIVESQQYPQGAYYSQPYSYEYGRSSYEARPQHEHHRSERVSPPSRTPSSTPVVQDSGGPVNPAP